MTLSKNGSNRPRCQITTLNRNYIVSVKFDYENDNVNVDGFDVNLI